MGEAGQVQLLTPKQEILFGARIFTGKLALRGLDRLRNEGLIPQPQQQGVDSLLNTSRSKLLLDNLTSYKISNEGNLGIIKVRDRYDAFLDRLLEDFRLEESLITPFIDRRLQQVTMAFASFNNMLEANQRLLIDRANLYAQGGARLELNDLIGFGQEGLFRAVAKFDFRRGNRFSTHAIWWIRQTIERALKDYGQTIRVPVAAQAELIGIRRKADEASKQNGRIVDPEELLDPSTQTGMRLMQALTARKPYSLNLLVGEREDTEIGEFLKDPAPGAEEAFENNERRRVILEVLSYLSNKERIVLTLRFGLVDDHQRTLEEIGRMFRVTRERIRQIEATALAKLRKNPQLSEPLYSLLQE